MSENTITLAADDKTANALVSTVKAAVNGDSKYLAYVVAHNVTRETVKDHSLALAALVYPNEKPVQKVDGKRTKFGNAVQKIAAGLRSQMEAKTPTTTDWIRLVRQAAENAQTKGEFSPEVIMSAVSEALSGESTTLTAVA
jgi:hypothetical protein